jgi:hypothetical protein
MSSEKTRKIRKIQANFSETLAIILDAGVN